MSDKLPAEPLWFLRLTEPDLLALARGRCLESVQRQALAILQPLTRSDAGIVTPVYTPDPEAAQ